MWFASWWNRIVGYLWVATNLRSLPRSRDRLNEHTSTGMSRVAGCLLGVLHVVREMECAAWGCNHTLKPQHRLFSVVYHRRWDSFYARSYCIVFKYSSAIRCVQLRLVPTLRSSCAISCLLSALHMIREMERPRSRHDSEIDARRGYSNVVPTIEFIIFDATGFDQSSIFTVCKRMTHESLGQCVFRDTWCYDCGAALWSVYSCTM